MKIKLETREGRGVQDVEVPRITPWPDVVTLGARSFAYHEAHAGHIVYRECFAVALEGYLPGFGTAPTGEEDRV